MAFSAASDERSGGNLSTRQVLLRRPLRLRAFQLAYGFSGQDLFQVVGELRKNERQEPGFARWSMLSDFAPRAEPKQPMQRQCVGKPQKEAAEGPLVCAERQ